MANKKIIFIISAVVLVGVVGVVALTQFSSNESLPNSEQDEHMETREEMMTKDEPAPTGNIDDSVDVIIGEASDDAVLSSEEEADASLITSDDQEITSFDQTHDETQF